MKADSSFHPETHWYIPHQPLVLAPCLVHTSNSNYNGQRGGKTTLQWREYSGARVLPAASEHSPQGSTLKISQYLSETLQPLEVLVWWVFGFHFHFGV